jgi:hypothetical protein
MEKRPDTMPQGLAGVKKSVGKIAYVTMVCAIC